MALNRLLGEKLVNGDGGEVDVGEVKAGVVGLLFSASWCGPCREFKPELVKFYQKFKDRLEIVLVSADRDQESFSAFAKEMPWPSVPYADKTRRAKLSSKFKVQGIPTLVLVDAATGRLITADGRAHVSQDPEGAEFPWPSKTLRELLPGTLAGPDGKPQPTDAVLDGVEVLMVYASASWCPPCRQFSPVLSAAYQKLKAEGKSVECVFVSSDRDQASFDEYHKKLGFYAVPFEERAAKAAVAQKYGISGIPSLIIMDPRTDKVINASGRAAVSTDPECTGFPWHPKPVNELNGGTAGTLQDRPALIAFLPDGTADAARNAVVAALNEVAASRKAGAAGGGGGGGGGGGDDNNNDDGDDDDDAVSYYFAGGDEIVARVRQVMGGRVAAGECALAILNLSEGVSHESDLLRPEDVTADAIKAFVARFEAGDVEGSPLQGGQ